MPGRYWNAWGKTAVSSSSDLCRAAGSRGKKKHHEWNGGKTHAQNGQDDVDQQVRSAPALEEDTERREDHSKNDFADVAGGRKDMLAGLSFFAAGNDDTLHGASAGAPRRGEGSACDAYLQVKGILAALSGFAMDYLSWAGLEVLLGWPADGTGVGRSAIVFFSRSLGLGSGLARERERDDRSFKRAGGPGGLRRFLK